MSWNESTTQPDADDHSPHDESLPSEEARDSGDAMPSQLGDSEDGNCEPASENKCEDTHADDQPGDGDDHQINELDEQLQSNDSVEQGNEPEPDDPQNQSQEDGSLENSDGAVLDDDQAPDQASSGQCSQQDDDVKSHPDQPESVRIIDAIESNASLLNQLLAKVDQLGAGDQAGERSNPYAESDPVGLITVYGDPDEVFEQPIDDGLEQPEDDKVELLSSLVEQAEDQNAELRHRNEELSLELAQRMSEIEDLKEQSGDLAAQLAKSNVKSGVAKEQSGTADALSWEERKELIMQQMEDDSFDAEQFIQTISEDGTESQDQEAEEAPQSPEAFVASLLEKLRRTESELEDRVEEVNELKTLLQDQSETRDSGVAIGAAAIAQMVDADELVVEERERLKELQLEWEKKFREAEIEASLERAKLARERSEVAKKQEDLEEKLFRFNRENKQDQDAAAEGKSRRWLAKLGIKDDSEEK